MNRVLGIISALFRCSQRSRRSVPELSNTNASVASAGERDAEFDNLWPYDHNELSLSHGLLKPRIITPMHMNSSGLIENADFNGRHQAGREKEKERDRERSWKSTVPGAHVPIASNTTAHEIYLALVEHLTSVLQIHGAVEFTPATLLQLRDCPAVTMSADVLQTRSLLLPPPASDLSSKGRRHNDLYDLWTQNVAALNSSRLAVAEFLEPGAGLIVSLPFDLISPFARTVSLLHIKQSVRYQIGRVYFSRSTSNDDVDVLPERDPGLLSKGQERAHMSPLGVGVGEHPLGANEVVFDIIKCGDGSVKTNVECEVLCAALGCLSTLRPYLPMLAVRITDSRLVDAILEICLWLSPSSSSRTPESCNIDIEKLLKALSLCTDVEERSTGGPAEGGKQPKCIQLLEELHLPPWLSKRLQPFFFLLSLQLTHSTSEGSPFLGDALLVLDSLEKEFYSLDVIISLQRLLARRSNESSNITSDALHDEMVNSKKQVTTSTATTAGAAAAGAAPALPLGIPKGKQGKGKHPINQTRLELASILGVIGVKATRSRKKDVDKNKDKEVDIQSDMKAVSNTIHNEQVYLFEESEEILRTPHKSTSSTVQSVFTRDDLARYHLLDYHYSSIHCFSHFSLLISPHHSNASL
jgi:hypothetical protein